MNNDIIDMEKVTSFNFKVLFIDDVKLMPDPSKYNKYLCIVPEYDMVEEDWVSSTYKSNGKKWVYLG